MSEHDYAWSWQRAINPVMGNQYAYMLYTIDNAEAYATVKILDFGEVGVKARDDPTLGVTIEFPDGYPFNSIVSSYQYQLSAPKILKLGARLRHHGIGHCKLDQEAEITTSSFGDTCQNEVLGNLGSSNSR